MIFCKNFTNIRLADQQSVGGKNGSLGQMISELPVPIRVPHGFAITVEAYRHILTHNNATQQLSEILAEYDVHYHSIKQLQQVGKRARALIASLEIPEVIEQEIIESYQQLSENNGGQQCSVAVRSSATAEDLPNASFAGQQESYLNVVGVEHVLTAYRNCLASLFTDRAIAYRCEKGFDHLSVGISVGVQYMVRSDCAAAGVMFTLDTESGFKNSVIITGSWGLGESVVKGEVIPDEFHVFKPMLEQGCDAIIKKERGTKVTKRVFADTGVVVEATSVQERSSFCLTDKEVHELASMALQIEQYYTQLHGRWCPMDIEWAKDGISGQLYIVQARPETVHSFMPHQTLSLEKFTLKDRSEAQVLVTGQSVGTKIATGPAYVVTSLEQIDTVPAGAVLVTYMTDPDWVPVMKKVAAIVTENGGRTCHAAIVSRELGIPAIVGALGATTRIPQGCEVTVDCSMGSEGTVYDKKLEIVCTRQELAPLQQLPVGINVNIAAPEYAYALSKLPVDGVGLARLEFIIANGIKVHPMACALPEKIQDAHVQEQVAALAAGYASSKDYFVQSVARGVGMIAAAFYPRPIICRFSDFKSNEYRGLLGGQTFEPHEENPMIGLRGASRYYHDLYAPAFLLECEALRYVRNEMGLTNTHVMIPFVRTVQEGKRVVELLNENGLVSGDNGLQIYMMCELPSNVLLIDQFAQHFDGFSIGSNDLTQTTLSVDRDSGLLTKLFDERDPAVLMMLKMAVVGARKAGKPIGICGQAPSDYPEIAKFLIDCGISSLSLNPDTVLTFMSKQFKNF